MYFTFYWIEGEDLLLDQKAYIVAYSMRFAKDEFFSSRSVIYLSQKSHSEGTQMELELNGVFVVNKSFWA